MHIARTMHKSAVRHLYGRGIVKANKTADYVQKHLICLPRADKLMRLGMYGVNSAHLAAS
jgi:hypothetical protein